MFTSSALRPWGGGGLLNIQNQREDGAFGVSLDVHNCCFQAFFFCFFLRNVQHWCFVGFSYVLGTIIRCQSLGGLLNVQNLAERFDIIHVRSLDTGQ